MLIEGSSLVDTNKFCDSGNFLNILLADKSLFECLCNVNTCWSLTDAATPTWIVLAEPICDLDK